MFLVSRVDLIAPLPCPLIQVLPTGESPPRQKVGLDEPERPLYACRTIGIPNRVRYKLKAEALAKGGHLRHRHHVASAAAQHHHVRVIDHGPRCCAAEVAERFREKDLAVETPEGGIALEKQHPRIAQYRRGGLHSALFTAQFQIVGRRVMLHLLARRKIIAPRRHWRCVADSVPPAERR